jgi:hypothetical protein
MEKSYTNGETERDDALGAIMTFHLIDCLISNSRSIGRDHTGFLLEQSGQNIANRTSIERKRILRPLTLVRRALTKDVPEIFSGTVEVNETYLGGQ